MVLYAIATAAALLLSRRRMPIWLAAFSFAVSVALPLLVTSQLDPRQEGGLSYSTWYVAAVGTLLTITATSRRPGFAWAGIIFLVLQTILWSGTGCPRRHRRDRQRGLGRHLPHHHQRAVEGRP